MKVLIQIVSPKLKILGYYTIIAKSHNKDVGLIIYGFLLDQLIIYMF